MMKQTLIADAPVRNQMIFKSQTPKENELKKDEHELIGKKMQFGIEIDEAAPNRAEEGSGRNNL